ncbi:sigma 54 modulation/S30EA ribosomal C-terminal domain-containing protein [Nocardia tengchongensis]|uniref:sigma 54 modulation/S30EA ribosomal C-terminal domain-containing protein n=1 Tax=Nocardia tengchongensis TaxID=2055889 RepID=UPI0036B33A1D
MLDRFHIAGGARVRITTANCENGPMLVQANLRIAGTQARVQSLTTGRGNIFPAVARLEHQIRALTASWEPRPWPDPARPPLTAPGGGPIARRKAVALRTVEPLAAAQSMDAMDYNVHLFIDADTGEDAIVYRAGPSGVQLARQRHVNPLQPQPDSRSLTINPIPAPVHTETAAAQRLRDHGLPFLFYTDQDSGRGHLLYRRYDADLTLLTHATGDDA